MDTKVTVIIMVMCYMACMLYIGYLAARRIKTSADFLLGGRVFGPVLTAIAHQAAALSGWLFIPWASQVAGSGFGAIWTAFSSGFAPFINFFVLGERVNRFSANTDSHSFIDMVEARYYDQKKQIIRVITCVIIAISITVYMSSQLMAAATTFKSVLGLDYTVSVLIGALVVIAYTSAGGLLAVAWTDFVQGMLMIGATLVGLLVALGATGGLGSVFEQLTVINPRLMSPLSIPPITIVGLLSAGWLGYMGQPHILQMFMGMKDPRSARKGGFIAGTTGVFLLFGTFLANLACIVLFPKSANTSTNFIQMILDYTPAWVVGIITAAILAAIMSSADALLHVATAAITQDVYNKIVKKGTATDREILLVGRISAVIIGGVATYMAFHPFDSILWVNWWAWGGLSVFAPIILFGLYWKRATREGAIAGMLIGFVSVYIWYKLGLHTTLHYTFVAFFVTAVVLTLVSLLTPEPPREVQEQVESLKQGRVPSA